MEHKQPDHPIASVQELAEDVTMLESMARRSWENFTRDPHRLESLLLARRRLQEGRSRLAAAKGQPFPILRQVPYQELMRFTEVAGEIAMIAAMLRNGNVNEQTQKAMSIKLGNLAVDVAQKQRSLNELYDGADATGTVPYDGKPLDA